MIGQPQFHSRGSLPLSPLILDDAGTVAHVWFKGAGILDRYANTWTQNGTVPQVPRSGKTPAGAGAFADANCYSLGSGNDALDFAVPFSIAIVYKPNALTNNPVPISNGAVNTNGYVLQSGAAVTAFFQSTAGSNAQAAVAAATVGQLNCVCCGVSATQVLAKINLGAINAVAKVATTAATGTAMLLGRHGSAGLALNGTIYEAWFSTTAPTDALFISIMNRVKERAAITAW